MKLVINCIEISAKKLNHDTALVFIKYVILAKRSKYIPKHIIFAVYCKVERGVADTE